MTNTGNKIQYLHLIMLILLLTKKILILCQALLKHKSRIVPVQDGHTHSFCPLYTNKYKYKHIDVCKAHYVMNWKLSNSFFPFYFISDGETERECVCVCVRVRERQSERVKVREREREAEEEWLQERAFFQFTKAFKFFFQCIQIFFPSHLHLQKEGSFGGRRFDRKLILSINC